jgi:Protein of unknown function (DUF3037)
VLNLMADLRKLEFFLLRYVPDAVKDEFVNIGVVMLEPGANGAGFADARFTRDWRRVRCLDPQADIEMLEALERDVRLQLRDTHDRETLVRKLQESMSNVIQLSSTKACLAEAPAQEIEALARLYMEAPKQPALRLTAGRQHIVNKMREAFEQAGVWKLLMQGIPASPYTRAGDPFKFDFGYRAGNSIKLFHAVSLKSSVDQAITLAARYPLIAKNIIEKTQASSFLTAVVDDGPDRANEQVQFALGMMEEAQVKVATVVEMAEIAEGTRRELLA